MILFVQPTSTFSLTEFSLYDKIGEGLATVGGIKDSGYFSTDLLRSEASFHCRLRYVARDKGKAGRRAAGAVSLRLA